MCMRPARVRTRRFPSPYCRRIVQTNIAVRRSLRGGPIWRGVGADSRSAMSRSTNGCARPAMAASVGAATSRGIGAGSRPRVRSRQQSGQQSVRLRRGCGSSSPESPVSQSLVSLQLLQQPWPIWAKSTGSAAACVTAKRSGQHSPPTHTTTPERVPRTTSTSVQSASSSAGLVETGLWVAADTAEASKP